MASFFKQDFLSMAQKQIRRVFTLEWVFKWWPLILVIILTTASFLYGWYIDNTKPHAGIGWADQNLYTAVAQKFARGELPVPGELHFQVGYYILGAFGALIMQNDPFMIISLALFTGSMVFCFLATSKLFNKWWALLFVALLLVRDRQANTFHFIAELFAIPWNNQVLFFSFAFFFWLLTTKVKTRPSNRLIGVVGLVAGLTIVTREEAVLFMIPLLGGYLLLTKALLRQWLLAIGIVMACFMPQLVIKTMVLGTPFESGHDAGYSQTAGRYFRLSNSHRNMWEVVIDSNHFNDPQARRKSLLQAVPWLWISPIGLGIIVFSKKHRAGLKLFIIVSGALILFYLSGSNMSAQKLQFHCLRYISPSFIALNLGVLVVGHTIYDRFKHDLLPKINK